MARAGAVTGIHPQRPLSNNAPRIVDVRLEEMLSWRASLQDASLVQDLHDMRIAAKRLRYALEMFDICFEGSKPLLKELTEIQEDVGTIHDLDVFLDVLRARLAALESPREELSVAILSRDSSAEAREAELQRLLADQAADPKRIGLIGLIGETIGERRRRFLLFQQRWGEGQLEEFAGRVRSGIGIKPANAREPRSDERTAVAAIDATPPVE